MFIIIDGCLVLQLHVTELAVDGIHIWYIRTARGRKSTLSHMIQVTMTRHLQVNDFPIVNDWHNTVLTSVSHLVFVLGTDH